jgi:hypothetical protein
MDLEESLVSLFIRKIESICHLFFEEKLLDVFSQLMHFGVC